jgi:hypothetical protein
MLVHCFLSAVTVMVWFLLVDDGKAYAYSSSYWTTRQTIVRTRTPLVSSSLFSSTSTKHEEETASSFEHSLVPDVNQPLPESLMALPRHSHAGVNDILVKTEATIKALHKHSQRLETNLKTMSDDNTGPCHEKVFANSYVDLGKVETVGFDYDYTLVTYTEELLELIYDMALKRLVHDRQYPLEMLDAGLKFNPRFSIRGPLWGKKCISHCLHLVHDVVSFQP